MKKIFYLVFFISLCFFSNIIFVKAKDCTYKSISGTSTINIKYDGECPIFYDSNRKVLSNALDEDGSEYYYDLSDKEIDIKPSELNLIYVNTDYVVITEKNYKDYDYSNLKFVYGYAGYQVLEKAREDIVDEGRYSIAYKYDSYVRITYDNSNVKIGSFYVAEGEYNYGVLGANPEFIKKNYLFLNNNGTYFYPSSLLYYRLNGPSIDNVDIGFGCLNGDNNIGCFQYGETKQFATLKKVLAVYKKTETKIIESCCYTANEANGTYFILNRYNNNQFKQEGYINPYFGMAGDNFKNVIESLSGQTSCPATIKTKKYEYTKHECNIKTGETTEEDNEIILGESFENLLGALKSPLQILSISALDFKLTVGNNKNATLRDITANEDLCSGEDCRNYSEYYTELGLKQIRSYCNEKVYSVYAKSKDVEGIDDRMNECIAFNTFYQELVENGIINNLGDGCGILPDELVDKLEFILDLLKVAGPLIALGLGTVDFIKVIANGDSDKEMKTAFKRFMTRLGAAALLFIIPVILAFLLDIFLRPEDGYDSDNPFCDVIDWNE